MKRAICFMAMVFLVASCNHSSSTSPELSKAKDKQNDSIIYKTAQGDIQKEQVTTPKPDKMDSYVMSNPENLNGSFVKTTNSRIKYDYLINYSNYTDGYKDSIVTLYKGNYLKDAVTFEEQVVSIQGDESNEGIFVWKGANDSVQLKNILDLSLYSGSMRSNEIDTIVRLSPRENLIFGKRTGGDEEDLYETFWIGLWSNERAFNILYYFSTSSSPILGTEKYRIEELKYNYEPDTNSIEISVLKKVIKGKQVLETKVIHDTILMISDLLEQDRSVEFNNG